MVTAIARIIKVSLCQTAHWDRQALARRSQRLGAERPGGWRGEAKREPKRIKGDSNLNKALDSPVGSSDMLGGINNPCLAAT